MKRGFSLATDTIVYVIIGILILFLLLFLFGEQSNVFIERLRGFFDLI